MLERSPSTISRELSRNRGGRGYRPKQAHRVACERHASNARQIDEATWRFAQDRLREALRADFYFAHPYASWERGTNENQWPDPAVLSEGMDFTTITQQEINHAMKRLNNRPRKRLGYLTPAQVFFRSGVALHD